MDLQYEQSLMLTCKNHPICGILWSYYKSLFFQVNIILDPCPLLSLNEKTTSNEDILHSMIFTITGWWFQLLWKIRKSVGMIIPNIWKIKTVPSHQPEWEWHWLSNRDSSSWTMIAPIPKIVDSITLLQSSVNRVFEHRSPTNKRIWTFSLLRICGFTYRFPDFRAEERT